MKLLGLKPRRFREWTALVELEAEGRHWLRMAFGMVYRLMFFGVSRFEWRTRLRTCGKCPIYNSKLRQCRPYSVSTYGCGCYVPYMAMTRGECWGKRHTDNLGWE